MAAASSAPPPAGWRAGGLSAGHVSTVAFWVFAIALALVGLVAAWKLAGRPG